MPADVDAGTATPERSREEGSPPAQVATARIEGARGPAVLPGTRRAGPVGARTLFLVLGFVMAVIVVALVLKARAVHHESVAEKQEALPDEAIGKHVPGLNLLAPTPPIPTVPAAPPAEDEGEKVTARGPERVASDLDVLQRRLSRGFGEGGTESSGHVEASEAPPGAPSVEPAGRSSSSRAAGLEEKLETAQLQVASAARLPDEDYLLTQGEMLDCVLETKIVSTVPGMTTCHLTRDVYSTNGRVVLLDRGSRVVGRYESGMQQGETRIFVLWTRVETPSGVVVELGSPGTGPLGEAGVGGFVDTRFWSRFGAAILLSIIEGGADAAAARAAGPDRGTTVSIGGTTSAGKDVVAKSMEPTINIPPVLYKNQGDRLAILVARDLDFRSVYGLERASPGEETGP